MFCNISIYYKLIKLFYVTPKDLAQRKICPAFIECLKNETNFNHLCPLYFGSPFAVLDKIQAAKTLFKDFLN